MLSAVPEHSTYHISEFYFPFSSLILLTTYPPSKPSLGSSRILRDPTPAAHHVTPGSDVAQCRNAGQNVPDIPATHLYVTRHVIQ